jgi:hypothetical protein
MNLNSIFAVNVVVAGLFGLGFIFAPEAMLAPYGIAADQAAASAPIGRLFGAATLGYAILFWFVRGTEPSAAKTGVVKAICLGFVASFLVSLFEQVSGTFGPLGWSTVALYAGFASAYGYFGFGNDQ